MEVSKNSVIVVIVCIITLILNLVIAFSGWNNANKVGEFCVNNWNNTLNEYQECGRDLILCQNPDLLNYLNETGDTKENGESNALK